MYPRAANSRNSTSDTQNEHIRGNWVSEGVFSNIFQLVNYSNKAMAASVMYV